ncbi:hypothetical protein IMSHALPRED_011112 [Imshaugia aleurites]|uniref:Uncharacterized protein n=1 Tax=Imshaugia aleurites TaxID=172621 RepID=A0A8H3IRA0_9LECA|nr:hypothetical protein IMSHALPRED_011112 [Imshaugia aleurites]
MDLAVVKQNENAEAFIKGTATEHPQMTLELVVKDPHTMLSNLITEFAHHCPKLRTLTIHLLINRHGKHFHQDFAADLSADNATGSALRQLWPRLDSLSILTLGPSLHETLPNLRLSIAEDKHWSGKCWANDGWFDQPESGFDPTYDFLKLEWPYLTLPSWAQAYVYTAISHSDRSARPPLKSDYIWKWTCQKGSKEGDRLDSSPAASQVLELEKERSMNRGHNQDC